VADGNLYIQGGGSTCVIAPQIPVVHPALALVLIFKLEWHEAKKTSSSSSNWWTRTVSQTGVRGEAVLRVSPLPFMKKGVELYQSTAHMLYGLRFDNYGAYRFRVVCTIRSSHRCR
jgi:hypothetical protein